MRYYVALDKRIQLFRQASEKCWRKGAWQYPRSRKYYVLIEDESKFYLPAYLIEKYDGNTLWFKIDGNEAKSKFMIATAAESDIHRL